MLSFWLLKADLDDKESLRLALKDAYAVFAMTNWPEIMNKEREIRQGKNIADVSKVPGLNIPRAYKFINNGEGTPYPAPNLEHSSLRVKEYVLHSAL